MIRPCLFICAILLVGIRVQGPAFGQNGELAPRYIIEKIKIRGNQKTHSSIIQEAISVYPGQTLSVDDPCFERSRLRLLTLGYFSDAHLTLEKGSAPGRVNLIVEVKERGTIILTDIFLGTSEATTAWAGLGVAENNLLGRGISLEGAFVLGSDPEVERGELQQSYFLRANSRKLGSTPLSLSGSFLFLDGSDFFRRSGSMESSDPQDFLSVRYRRVGGTLGIGYPVGQFSRLFIDYRGEAIHSDAPLGAIRIQPDGTGEPIQFSIKNGTSVLSAVTLSLNRDTRSDSVLPDRGSLFTVNAVFATSYLGSSYDFFKLSAGYEYFFPLRWRHVLSTQLAGGTVFGVAPFFEKFFIGDFNDLVPSRALGLNFSTLPSRNIFGTNIANKRYEEIVLRGSLEYIIPWFRGGRFAYGADFFLNVGVIFLASRDNLDVRDQSLGQSIPVDLTMNAGMRLDTAIGIFCFSVGNALGRIPF